MMTKSQEIFRNKAKIAEYARECGIEKFSYINPFWTKTGKKMKRVLDD